MVPDISKTRVHAQIWHCGFLLMRTNKKQNCPARLFPPIHVSEDPQQKQQKQNQFPRQKITVWNLCPFRSKMTEVLSRRLRSLSDPQSGVPLSFVFSCQYLNFAACQAFPLKFSPETELSAQDGQRIRRGRERWSILLSPLSDFLCLHLPVSIFVFYRWAWFHSAALVKCTWLYADFCIICLRSCFACARLKRLVLCCLVLLFSHLCFSLSYEAF